MLPPHRSNKQSGAITPKPSQRLEEGASSPGKAVGALHDLGGRAGPGSSSDNALDAADQAVQSYQKELLFSQGTSGHEQLALVRLALKRLDEGSYGECLQCGKTIGIKRLEALPWTPYCIECREKIENGEIEDPVCRRLIAGRSLSMRDRSSAWFDPRSLATARL